MSDDFDSKRDGTVYMCLQIKSVYFLLVHLDNHASNLGQVSLIFIRQLQLLPNALQCVNLG